MATNKMMNGVERAALTIQPTVLFSGPFSSTPPWSVRRKNTPSGTPIKAPTTPEMPTITTVSHSEVANSSSIISEKFSNMVGSLHRCDDFDLDPVAAQISHGALQLRPAATGKQRQRAKGLPLNLVNLPVQDA